MKFILVLISLFLSCVVYAQTDTDVPQNAKPSWSSRLPDRNDAPELDTDEEDDEELSGLTMDRSALVSDDEDSSLISEDNSETRQENEGVSQQEKQAEVDRIAEQEKLAEADRIAEQEELAEADRIAEQEKLAEADRIAEQERQAVAAKIAEQEKQSETTSNVEQEQQAEIDRITKQEKVAQDQKIAAENRALEQAQVTENTANSTENTQKIESRPYTWKKIKNRAPEYPVKAARDGKEGWVDVEFTIDNSGKVIGAHPAKTYKNSKLFNKAALRAVRQWRFEPPSNYGIRLNQTKTVRVIFNLAE